MIADEEVPRRREQCVADRGQRVEVVLQNVTAAGDGELAVQHSQLHDLAQRQACDHDVELGLVREILDLRHAVCVHLGVAHAHVVAVPPLELLLRQQAALGVHVHQRHLRLPEARFRCVRPCMGSQRWCFNLQRK